MAKKAGATDSVTLTGGCAKNEGLKKAIEKVLKIKVVDLPVDPQLMDLRMPVMSGIAAAKAIRELDRPDSLSVPIIAVSADAYQENVDECIASGMNGHIAKPIDASVLLKTVYEQLK